MAPLARISPQVSVRRAGPRDLDRLAALWSAVVAHHVRLDPLFAVRPDAEGAIRELLAAQLRDPDAAVFVWERGGDLPGFCAARIDRAPSLLVEAERAEITDLGVREDARRRGIGSALVAAALGWIAERGVRRVEVRAAVANREGQAFWRALGFTDLMDVLHRRL